MVKIQITKKNHTFTLEVMTKKKVMNVIKTNNRNYHSN